MKRSLRYILIAIVAIVSLAASFMPAAAQTETHSDRLIRLDPVYRSQGWNAWLEAAGVKCSAVVDARQPEEETVIGSDGATHVVVSGIQINGQCNVPWPAIVTTDTASYITTNANTRQYQPDLRNPSVMYTNVDSKGPVTIWIDGTNWGQLTPAGGTTSVAPASTPVPVTPANPAPHHNWWNGYWSGWGGLFCCVLPLIIIGLIIIILTNPKRKAKKAANEPAKDAKPAVETPKKVETKPAAVVAPVETPEKVVKPQSKKPQPKKPASHKKHVTVKAKTNAAPSPKKSATTVKAKTNATASKKQPAASKGKKSR